MDTTGYLWKPAESIVNFQNYSSLCRNRKPLPPYNIYSASWSQLFFVTCWIFKANKIYFWNLAIKMAAPVFGHIGQCILLVTQHSIHDILRYMCTCIYIIFYVQVYIHIHDILMYPLFIIIHAHALKCESRCASN